jgi:hypothetical protein
MLLLDHGATLLGELVDAVQLHLSVPLPIGGLADVSLRSGRTSRRSALDRLAFADTSRAFDLAPEVEGLVVHGSLASATSAAGPRFHQRSRGRCAALHRAGTMRLISLAV